MKYLLLAIIIITLIFQLLFYYKIRKEKELIKKSEIDNEIIYILKNNITSSISNNNLYINDVTISSNIDDTNARSIYDYISLPCLIIYIPKKDVCMACVNFAIDNVKSKFPDFPQNENIILLTSEYNPNIISRIYGKKVFHFTQKTKSGFGIPVDSETQPQYFLLSADKRISSFFTPNSAIKELTEIYLENIKTLITASQCH